MKDIKAKHETWLTAIFLFGQELKHHHWQKPPSGSSETWGEQELRGYHHLPAFYIFGGLMGKGTLSHGVGALSSPGGKLHTLSWSKLLRDWEQQRGLLIFWRTSGDHLMCLQKEQSLLLGFLSRIQVRSWTGELPEWGKLLWFPSSPAHKVWEISQNWASILHPVTQFWWYELGHTSTLSLGLSVKSENLAATGLPVFIWPLE